MPKIEGKNCLFLEDFVQNTSFIKTKNHLILNFFSKKALAVVVFLCFALCVFAANYTWTGGGVEGKWDDPVNWGGSGYPGESDKAIFQSNTYPQITSALLAFQSSAQVSGFSSSLIQT